MRDIRLRTISLGAVAVAIPVGVAMIVIGVVFIVMGATAKNDIAGALRQESITTSDDAPIPGVLVEDAATARAQQDAIEAHTFGRFGPYSGMQQGDPNREAYISGLTLRNALNLAVVGFGVGDLAMGMGAITVVLGVFIAGFTVPVHILVRRIDKDQSAEARSAAAAREA